jgi:hypothetical protein
MKFFISKPSEEPISSKKEHQPSLLGKPKKTHHESISIPPLAARVFCLKTEASQLSFRKTQHRRFPINLLLHHNLHLDQAPNNIAL